MKIICPKEILLEKINIVLKGINSKTTSPILECILLKAKDGWLYLTSNDLEMGIETSPMEANIIEEGSLALDAKIFSDIIKRLPDNADVSITSDENNVTLIKCLKTQFKIPGKPGYEFPELPYFEKTHGYAINSNILKNMIRQTIFAASTDESKPSYTGVLFHIDGGSLVLVAVDGYRVSFRKEFIDAETDNYAIIPAKTVNEVSKILAPDEEVKMYFTDKHCLFELKGATIVSRLLQGDFVKYKQVFIDECKTEVKINKEQFADSMERALLIAKDSLKNPVKLNIGDDLCVISSLTEIGASYDEINCEVDGDSLEIGFNPRYILDALRALEGEFVTLRLMGSLSPAIIDADFPENSRQLVMPLRLK